MLVIQCFRFVHACVVMGVGVGVLASNVFCAEVV